MTQSQNLSCLLSPLNPAIAELFSTDKRFVFRILFNGYQFSKKTRFSSDSDWYRVIIEFQGPGEHYRRETCKFDAWSFIEASKRFEKFRRSDEAKRILLAPPYGAGEVSLEYRKGHLKKRPRPFQRDRQGLFVSASEGNFSFSFKVNRADLLIFFKNIRKATQLLPIRDIERAKKLGRL